MSEIDPVLFREFERAAHTRQTILRGSNGRAKMSTPRTYRPSRHSMPIFSPLSKQRCNVKP